jgi:hypothetical protein
MTDYCPYVTWDKKYLIFTSGRLNKDLTNGKTKTYRQLNEMLSGRATAGMMFIG